MESSPTLLSLSAPHFSFLSSKGFGTFCFALWFHIHVQFGFTAINWVVHLRLTPKFFPFACSLSVLWFWWFSIVLVRMYKGAASTYWRNHANPLWYPHILYSSTPPRGSIFYLIPLPFSLSTFIPRNVILPFKQAWGNSLLTSSSIRRRY